MLNLKSIWTKVENWYDHATGRKRRVAISPHTTQPTLKEMLKMARDGALVSAPKYRRLGDKRRLTFCLAEARLRT